MSKSNGKGSTVDVVIRADTETGKVGITGPPDPILLLRVLTSAQAAVLVKIEEARAKAAESKVQIAPASALPHLRR